MAGMASEYARAMARKRWSGLTQEQRSAAGRTRVAKRWRKDTTKVEQPAITLEQAIACLRNAIASKPGGTFYSAPFDRLATWLVSP